jgi:hypothetical protein
VSVFLYSIIDYAVAIALKYAVQIPTINPVTNYFETNSVCLGVFMVFKPVFFEVDLAILVAGFAVHEARLIRRTMKLMVRDWLLGKRRLARHISPH